MFLVRARSVEGQGYFVDLLLVDLHDFVQGKPRPRGTRLVHGHIADWGHSWKPFSFPLGRKEDSWSQATGLILSLVREERSRKTRSEIHGSEYKISLFTVIMILIGKWLTSLGYSFLTYKMESIVPTSLWDNED